MLMVTRLSRLGGSTRDLLNTPGTIADRKAAFRSLGHTWGDATTAQGRLMVTMLGGSAEFERELIRARACRGVGHQDGAAAENDPASDHGRATPPRRRRPDVTSLNRIMSLPLRFHGCCH